MLIVCCPFQMVQLHDTGGAAERAGGWRRADRHAAAARPAPHGGGTVGRGQRGETTPRGEAARQAAGAGGGGGDGGGEGAPRAPHPRAALVHARGALAARAALAAAATTSHVHASLLGKQASPRMGRLPGYLLITATRLVECCTICT